MGFEGEVLVRWLNGDDDRKMKLLADFSFVDDDGKRWTAPAEWEVDGASIPGFFWNTVGPPFVGAYRRASVVHDYYCDVKTERWQDVHRLFHHACLAGGVPAARARVMFAAVWAGGPRWPDPFVEAPPGVELPPEPMPTYTDAQLAELMAAAETAGSLEEIEDLAEALATAP